MNVEPRQRVFDIKTITAHQAHRRTSRQARLDHIGDKGGLPDQTIGALQCEIVMRRVEIENPNHQNIEGDQVKGDDLARQRRFAKRKPPPLRTMRSEFGFVHPVGCNEIIPKDNIVILSLRHIAPPYPLGESHYSSLYL